MTRIETPLSAVFYRWTVLQLPLILIQEYNSRNLSTVDTNYLVFWM